MQLQSRSNRTISCAQRKHIEDYYENNTEQERIENIDTYRKMFNYRSLQSSSTIDGTINDYINTDKLIEVICLDYQINVRTFYRNLGFVKDVITFMERK